MSRQRQVFTVALVTAIILSGAACFPLTNVLTGNDAGWFTMSNIDEYGSDLDQRAEQYGGEVVVFTGHPSYVIAADNARLLFDQPRNHYFASTFNDSELGDRWYANLTSAFRNGRADLVVYGPMTDAVYEMNQTATAAFVANYCRVADTDGQQLYNRTGATLYRYDPDCPAGQQPNRGPATRGP